MAGSIGPGGIESYYVSANRTGIPKVVGFTPMKRGKSDAGETIVLGCFYGVEISIKVVEPSIEGALFHLKVLVFFFVIPGVNATGMKVSFTPGFDKSVCVDGDFGGVIAEKKPFGVSSLFEDGVHVQWLKVLVDGTRRCIFLMIAGMG